MVSNYKRQYVKKCYRHLHDGHQSDEGQCLWFTFVTGKWWIINIHWVHVNNISILLEQYLFLVRLKCGENVLCLYCSSLLVRFLIYCKQANSITLPTQTLIHFNASSVKVVTTYHSSTFCYQAVHFPVCQTFTEQPIE